MDEVTTSVPAHAVSKESIAVAIRTTDQLIVGLLHARPKKRLKDELNTNSDHFLAVTEARVYDASGSRLLYDASCVLLASTFVVSVTPLSAASSADAAWAGVLAYRTERAPRP